jgi:hypothetical protein
VPLFETSDFQQSTPADKEGDDAGKKQEQKPEETTNTAHDRLFWALPNFLTVDNSEHVSPLTAGQKLNIVARSSFDLVEYPWYGFLAGIGQAENDEEGYGQGGKGYVKRFGAAFTDGTIENFMVGAAFAGLLHQDPRYYQLGKGGVWHRAGYSVSRLFVTRGDAGRAEFNFSEVLGGAVTAGLSNTYHPAGDRTVANTMTVWGTQMGYDALSIVVKEFWPDIRRKLSKHKDKSGD